MSDKPIPIDLRPHMALIGNGREFLRMWAQQDGPVTCFINPIPVGPDPAAFGVVLVDAIRHAARTWSKATGVPEAQALERIWQGLDAERTSPSDTVSPTPDEDGLI